jgi:pimeloyl-ACP methyl ester carboxylesterase
MNTNTVIVRLCCLCLVAAAVIGMSGAEGRSAQSTVKPTIVLVHGAFEDGTAWQHVISILQRDRYNVVAVQAPLTSLAADVQATKRVLDAQDGPVVVVGHSWGGAVITDAAAGDPRVKALVYIAAFAPDANEAVTAFNDKYPTRLGSALKPDSAGYLSVDPAQFHELFARDVPAAQARIAAATQKPILGSALGDSVVQAAWRSVPAWYLITLEDQAIQPDLQRFYAERMKAKTREFKSSHLVIVSHAAEVARLIEEAARP